MQYFSRFMFVKKFMFVVMMAAIQLGVVGADDDKSVTDRPEADSPAIGSSATGKSTEAESVANEAGVEAGLKAIKDKDFDKAFELFTILAKAGNAEAQHNLAMLYRTGKGTPKNLPASFEWFRRAADQGISDAQYYLGHMYDGGEGVEQDPKYAYVWYRKAAEQGHGFAQINLGFLYANGIGVAQDIEQAYLWFHVAAAQGYKIAFENKDLIEEALKKQENGEALLESLKIRARAYFQQYVQPYGLPPSSHQSFKAPRASQPPPR